MKPIFGAISITIATMSYIPYVRDILLHKTKPHALTWFTWAFLSAISFGIQITHHAGAGAWLMGLSFFAASSIFILSLKYGERNIVTIDWISFVLAMLALILWVVVNKPLISVILLIFIDVLGGFFPTVRKSFFKPFEETIIIYFLFAISLVFSLMALDQATLVNVLYPSAFVVVNMFMVIYLHNRRKTVGNHTS